MQKFSVNRVHKVIDRVEHESQANSVRSPIVYRQQEWKYGNSKILASSDHALCETVSEGPCHSAIQKRVLAEVTCGVAGGVCSWLLLPATERNYIIMKSYYKL